MTLPRYTSGPILALDSATVTGVAEGVPGGTPVLETIDFGHRAHDDEFDVWSRAIVWITRRIIAAQEAGPGISLIVLEGLVPQYDKTVQAGLYAGFGGIARSKGIPILIAPIPTWRLYALGSGRLPGKIAKAKAVELCARLGWQAPDHNAAEAACQWLWACACVAPKAAHRVEPLFLRRGAA